MQLSDILRLMELGGNKYAPDATAGYTEQVTQGNDPSMKPITIVHNNQGNIVSDPKLLAAYQSAKSMKLPYVQPTDSQMTWSPVARGIAQENAAFQAAPTMAEQKRQIELQTGGANAKLIPPQYMPHDLTPEQEYLLSGGNYTGQNLAALRGSVADMSTGVPEQQSSARFQDAAAVAATDRNVAQRQNDNYKTGVPLTQAYIDRKTADIGQLGIQHDLQVAGQRYMNTDADIDLNERQREVDLDKVKTAQEMIGNLTPEEQRTLEKNVYQRQLEESKYLPFPHGYEYMKNNGEGEFQQLKSPNVKPSAMDEYRSMLGDTTLPANAMAPKGFSSLGDGSLVRPPQGGRVGSGLIAPQVSLDNPYGLTPEQLAQLHAAQYYNTAP